MALRGIKVIEMMGLAPGPLCGTILADFGANVTVIQKINPSPFDVMSNGKRMISVNMKSKEGIEIVQKLCLSADVLLDTFRPGVMEKLGLGPEQMMKGNKKLIYARLTGYGQSGIYKDKGGHDINYTAMSGILSLLRKGNNPPVPPLNFTADFAGGSVACALGIVLALYARTSTGAGQVVDASMAEGAAYVGTWLFKSRNLPIWASEHGSNILDGGSPFYSTYKTKDNKFMAVGALEPQFYENFLKGLQLSQDEFSQFSDPELMRKKFEELFLTKTQQEWSQIFDGLDACVTPVLELDQLADNKCTKSRGSFYQNEEDLPVPEPAPRLSRTPGVSTGRLPLPQPGEHTIQILQELKYNKKQIQSFINNGTVCAKVNANL
ncbi:alpha-methylacyl-CoA racemase [Plutella xylostella]|uniref:alpha-methylacyl-CoA racemase n=1 Tax=Plutella xylostella TaxID=51655 RepID=UPI002032733A|nr:alpha-methylacyl-CoA racemase [Plutella xylostella]